MNIGFLGKTIPLICLTAIAQPVVAGETRYDLEGFTQVDAAGGIWLEVVSGTDEYSVIAETERGFGLSNVLRISTSGDKLKIRRKSGMSLLGLFEREIHVTVHLPELTELSVAAGSDAVLRGELGGALTIDVSSGSELEAPEVNAARIVLSASAGSDLEISGHCRTLDVSASSGSDVEAYDLTCSAVTAEAASGGSVEVTATDSIRASASSGGEVSVEGNPSERDLSHSIGGAVRLRG